MKFKAFLHLIEHFWDFTLVMFKTITYEKMRDQIQEDKNSGTSTECNMLSSWFNLQATAHWSFHKVNVI